MFRKKNKSKQNAPKAQPKQTRFNPTKLVAGDDRLDQAAIGAAKMLMNPCGAELVPSVYPGDMGYMARFNSRFTAANIAGETCNAVVFKPGNNVMANFSNAASSTTVTLGFADTQAPGAAFLNSNATKVRATGACIEVQPISAPNAATGVIYFGIVPASSCAAGLIRSCDQLAQLCTHQVTVSQALMQPLEIRWVPGTFDDRYSPVQGITSDDDTDRNVLLVVTIGMPAATGLNFRATAIYEWAPEANVGVPYDATTVKPSKCDIGCTIRNLRRKDANWWWQLGSKAAGVGATALGYYVGGPIGAATALAKYL